MAKLNGPSFDAIMTRRRPIGHLCHEPIARSVAIIEPKPWTLSSPGQPTSVGQSDRQFLNFSLICQYDDCIPGRRPGSPAVSRLTAPGGAGERPPTGARPTTRSPAPDWRSRDHARRFRRRSSSRRGVGPGRRRTLQVVAVGDAPRRRPERGREAERESTDGRIRGRRIAGMVAISLITREGRTRRSGHNRFPAFFDIIRHDFSTKGASRPPERIKILLVPLSPRTGLPTTSSVTSPWHVGRARHRVGAVCGLMVHLPPPGRPQLRVIAMILTLLLLGMVMLRTVLVLSSLKLSRTGRRSPFEWCRWPC